jgi:hypothetical protein
VQKTVQQIALGLINTTLVFTETPFKINVCVKSFILNGAMLISIKANLKTS